MLLFVIVFALADVPQMRFPQRERASDSIIEKPKPIAAKPLSKDSLLLDSLKRDSLLKNDTSLMDSLHKAIWIHNKAIDDSLRADSINRQRKNGIDAPPCVPILSIASVRMVSMPLCTIRLRTR